MGVYFFNDYLNKFDPRRHVSKNIHFFLIPLVLSVLIITLFLVRQKQEVNVKAQVYQGPLYLNYTDLVARLIDLEQLAVLPRPGEKGGEASSYDRKSTYNATTNTYVSWDANDDCCGVIRNEGSSQVLAEMTGPGVIWRLWSATPGNGKVKIYIDGEATPSVDLPFIGYFNLSNAPFVYPSLVYKTAAEGYNSYIPIPYQRSIKIVGDAGWGKYFNITYSTYPSDTTLPLFQTSLPADALTTLTNVNNFLLNQLGTDPGGARQGEVVDNQAFTILPNQSATVSDLNGQGAISAIKVRLDPASAGNLSTTLRELMLKISWDGETSPSVLVPLGDFFGSAPGQNYFKSLATGMNTDGTMYSYWYMPYASSAKIEIQNDGVNARSINFSVTHSPLTYPIDSLGRFHAKWHRNMFLPTEASRKIDWTMLKTQGQGRFLGTMLHIYNPSGGWWGEGDEKFFVDGEKFPSSFGTGSEDYFGYAWSSIKLFQEPFHGQTIVKNAHVSNFRWMVADNVPFQTSFEGAMEKYFGSSTIYANTVYWYLSASGTDPYTSYPSLSDRIGYYASLPNPVTPTLSPTSAIAPTISQGPNPTTIPGVNGLNATYFKTKTLTTPVLSRVDPKVDFNWGGGSPDLLVPKDNFSVRWTGYVLPQYSQTYTFYTSTDDGVRLWVNDMLLIDKWKDQSLTSYSAPITLTGGQKYSIKMEYYEGWSNAESHLYWSSSSVPKQIVPQSQLFTTNDIVIPVASSIPTIAPTATSVPIFPTSTTAPTATPVVLPTSTPVQTGGSGLNATYFSDKNLQSVFLTTTNSTVNFNWGTGSPVSGMSADNFSIRWEGYVTTPASGQYTFYTTSDDGNRLWVNGQKILDKWFNTGGAENSASISLTAGQKYPIKLEYYEGTNNAKMELRWSGPGISKQIIPSSNLSTQ